MTSRQSEDPVASLLIWPSPWRMVTLTHTSYCPYPRGYICSTPRDTHVVSDIETSPWDPICFLRRGQWKVVIRAELDPPHKLLASFAKERADREEWPRQVDYERPFLAIKTVCFVSWMFLGIQASWVTWVKTLYLTCSFSFYGLSMSHRVHWIRIKYDWIPQ